jgi:choline dehydrogenase-like flavoprotein
MDAGCPDTRIWDLIVVGSGPNGLAVALHARKRGLGVLIIERGHLAENVTRFPKQLVFLQADLAARPRRLSPAYWDGLRISTQRRQRARRGWGSRSCCYQEMQDSLLVDAGDLIGVLGGHAYASPTPATALIAAPAHRVRDARLAWHGDLRMRTPAPRLRPNVVVGDAPSVAKRTSPKDHP